MTMTEPMVRMTCDHKAHRGRTVTLAQADTEWRGCTYDREPLFVLAAVCPKCTGDRWTWRFIPRGFHMKHAGGHWCAAKVDHLDLRCERCGFQFNMRTKDEEGA